MNAKIVHKAFLKELDNIQPIIKDEKKLEQTVLTFVKEKFADRLVVQEESKRKYFVVERQNKIFRVALCRR